MSGVCAVAESADEELRKKVEGKVPRGRQCVVVFVEASTPHTCKLHDDEDGSFFFFECVVLAHELTRALYLNL
jgi:hypothetical protein